MQTELDQTVVSQEATITHEGRFGFYPCDYQTYRKLKRLNYLLLQSKIASAAQQRWDRKEPQNRVRRIRVSSRGPVIRTEPIIRPLGIKVSPSDALRIESDYRNARYPKSSPQNVLDLAFNVLEIDAILDSMEKDFAAIVLQRKA